MRKNIFSLANIANAFALTAFNAVGSETAAAESTAPAAPVVPPIEVSPGMVAVPVKFTFKTRTIKSDQPGVEDKKLPKQPAVTANLPNFTASYLAALFSDSDPANDKARGLVLDYANEIFREQAKSQFEDVIDSFGEDENQKISATHLDYDKLTLEFISNLPPAQRGRQAISDEDWNTFFKDYLSTMLKATGKDLARLNKHVEIFKKPTKVKSQNDAMVVMVDQLDIYLAHSSMLEDTGTAAKRLRDKFDAWLKEDAVKYDPAGL